MTSLFEHAQRSYREMEKENKRMSAEIGGLMRILGEIADANGGSIEVRPKVRGLDLRVHIDTRRDWTYLITAEER